MPRKHWSCKSQWHQCTDTLRKHLSHNGSNAQNRRGPSGDNARRSPFWRLWVLRLPLQRARGAQRRQRAPQPLLEALGTAPATAESEGGPAATTRAAAPSGGSGYCACHCREREGGPAATTRAAAPARGSGYCACHCRERGVPSGDNVRRSLFWRLWVLRLPLQRERGAQRRQRAPQPLLEPPLNNVRKLLAGLPPLLD